MAPAPIDISEAPPSGEDETAKAKRAAENKKKRERQKAKKQADKAASEAVDATELGRWHKGKLPGGRAERREAGVERGLGVFALEPIAKDQVVASAPPSLSCVFDTACDEVCGFCFAAPGKDGATEVTLALTTGPTVDDPSKKSYGIEIKDVVPAGAPADAKAVATIVSITKESANRDRVQLGDRIISINGEEAGGQEGAVAKLLEAAKRGDASVPCVVSRPALLGCMGCNKFAACAKCVGAGRMKWHNFECGIYCTMRKAQPSIEKGESATLRLLVRHKVSTVPDIGDWDTKSKEPIDLLTSLQANATDVPPEQLAGLSRLTGMKAETVARILYQVRTNACEVVRAGKKAGCALSVLMGWHNHDCLPSCQATVTDEGHVTITALRDIKEGEELSISYVDATKPYEERRAVLEKHYGFECKCERCTTERSRELKARLKQRDQYLAAQRR